MNLREIDEPRVKEEKEESSSDEIEIKNARTINTDKEISTATTSGSKSQKDFTNYYLGHSEVRRFSPTCIFTHIHARS